jgi:hypothetical protein
MGLLADGWAWLDTNSKQIGALGAITFGLSSAIVAWLAYRLNRQNNLGLKPIVLLKSLGIFNEDDRRYLTCAFEVWNRRKYPLVVRHMTVVFPGMKVEHGAHVHPRKGEKTDWLSTDTGMLSCHKKFSIDPSSHREFRASGPVAKNENTGFFATLEVEVWVDVFDPIKNDRILLRFKEAPEGRRQRWRQWRHRWWGPQWPKYSSAGPVTQGYDPDSD